MNRPDHVRASLRRAVVGISLAIASFAAVASLAPAAQAATLGNVWTVAAASYSCGSRTVSVLPQSNEPLTGSYSVFAYAQVYDYNLGRWITEPQWTRVDGITSHVFYGITKPYQYAKVTYARLINGTWRYAADWVSISSDLDNSAVFCNASGW